MKEGNDPKAASFCRAPSDSVPAPALPMPRLGENNPLRRREEHSPWTLKGDRASPSGAPPDDLSGGRCKREPQVKSAKRRAGGSSFRAPLPGRATR